MLEENLAPASQIPTASSTTAASSTTTLTSNASSGGLAAGSGSASSSPSGSNSDTSSKPQSRDYKGERTDLRSPDSSSVPDSKTNNNNGPLASSNNDSPTMNNCTGPTSSPGTLNANTPLAGGAGSNSSSDPGSNEKTRKSSGTPKSSSSGDSKIFGGNSADCGTGNSTGPTAEGTDPVKKSSPHHSSSSSSPKNVNMSPGSKTPRISPGLGVLPATCGNQSSPSPSSLVGKDGGGNNMTAPSTPVAATTPKAPSVGNVSLDQSQENDGGSMSDDLALQSLLTAATSVATSSAGVTPSPTSSGLCMSGGLVGDPMESLRGVTDLLDGNVGILGLDTPTGSTGTGANNGGGSVGMGGHMSNVQMGPMAMCGGMPQAGGPAPMGKNSCQMGNSGGGGMVAGSMDNSYMQNRIFVFSTQMANKGAEMVINGHFLSIIAYHCSQPETKKILENYPMKIGQFNRGNPAMANWMQQQQQQQGGMQMCGGGPMQPGHTKGKRGAANANLGGIHSRNKVTSGAPPSSMMGPACNSNASLFGMTNMGDCGMDGGGVMPDFPPEDMAGALSSLAGASASSSLQGVKIPDENLTPEQMAHRQERFEKLRQIEMMLLPENVGGGATGGASGGSNEQTGVGAGPASGRGIGGVAKSPINPVSSGSLGTTTTTSSISGDCALSKNNSTSGGPTGVECSGPGGGLGVGMPNSGGNNMMFSGGPRGPSPQHQLQPGAMGPGAGWKRQHSMPGGMGMMGGLGPGGFPGGPNYHHGNGMSNMHHMGNLQQPPFKGTPQGQSSPMHGMGGGGPHQQQHRMMMNGGPGPCDMGPGAGIPPGGNGGLPPPYHQTHRSTSVPMGGSLHHHPGSGVGGSMMPRGMGGGSGGMPFQKDWPGNGPMDVNSNNNSIVPCPNMSPNMTFCPSTSMGSGHHQSSGMNSSSNNNNNANNNSNNKEPNLMPVPSPQQIQYLNQFEGQELTIQKQPNSAPSGPGGNPHQHMGANLPNNMGMMEQPHLDVGPQMCLDKHSSGAPPTSKGANSLPTSSASSPLGPSPSIGPKMGGPPKSENFLANANAGGNSGGNSSNRCGPPPGDPIASLTQMSQQLATGGTMTASSVAGGASGGSQLGGVPMTVGGAGPGGSSMMMSQIGGVGGPGMGLNSGQGNFPPVSGFMGGLGPGPGGQNFMNAGATGTGPGGPGGPPQSHMMLHQSGHIHGGGGMPGMGGGNGAVFPGNGAPGGQMGPMMNPGMGPTPNMMRMGMGVSHQGGGGGMMGGPVHIRGGPPQFMQQHMRPPFGGNGGGPPGMPGMMCPNGPGGGPMQQNIIQVKPNAPNTIQYLPTRTQLQQQQHQQQQQQMMRGAGPIM